AGEIDGRDLRHRLLPCGRRRRCGGERAADKRNSEKVASHLETLSGPGKHRTSIPLEFPPRRSVQLRRADLPALNRTQQRKSAPAGMPPERRTRRWWFALVPAHCTGEQPGKIGPRCAAGPYVFL